VLTGPIAAAAAVAHPYAAAGAPRERGFWNNYTNRSTRALANLVASTGKGGSQTKKHQTRKRSKKGKRKH
jgi:hypothetical protein